MIFFLCRYVFVPGNCTGELQPLDLSVMGFIKKTLKDEFSAFYSDQVSTLMMAGASVEELRVGLRKHWSFDAQA